jgi:single-strand DNA-binding protein
VVIPRFSGALTMLDGQGSPCGEAGAVAGYDALTGGNGDGSPAPHASKVDLDDDIPF